MTAHCLPDAASETAAYEKLRLAVRYWLLGRRYTLALRAMEYAAGFHTGTRKDGAPEFSHQVWQVAYLRTMEPMLLHPEETIATVFLHDLVEDYPVSLSDIASRFGSRIAAAVDAMSKVVEGQKKSGAVYFPELAADPIASVAKGVDRVHNHKTMIGGFSSLKQRDYLGETEADILPMLKAARRAHPEQELVYENIKHMLIQQIELYAYALETRLGPAV